MGVIVETGVGGEGGVFSEMGRETELFILLHHSQQPAPRWAPGGEMCSHGEQAWQDFPHRGCLGDVGVHAEPMRRGTRFRSIPATESVFHKTGTKHILQGSLPPPTHISILRRGSQSIRILLLPL